MEAKTERWMKTASSIRGEIIRQVGEAMRRRKKHLTPYFFGDG